MNHAASRLFEVVANCSEVVAKQAPVRYVEEGERQQLTIMAPNVFQDVGLIAPPENGIFECSDVNGANAVVRSRGGRGDRVPVWWAVRWRWSG